MTGFQAGQLRATPLTSPPLVGSQHLYAERTAIAMQAAPDRPPLVVAATHTAIWLVSLVCPLRSEPGSFSQALPLADSLLTSSSSLFSVSSAWCPEPCPGGAGCFLLPHHPLLVSAPGSDSPSAALKPKEEKSTRFSIGAEARSAH